MGEFELDKDIELAKQELIDMQKYNGRLDLASMEFEWRVIYALLQKLEKVEECNKKLFR